MRASNVAAVLIAVIATSPAGASAQSRVVEPEEAESLYAPPVDLWLQDVELRYGELIRPHFATEPGAYVTIVRVDSEGELRVLYPRRPSMQTPYRLGQFANDRVPYNGERSFHVFETSGRGFVFAIASYERFDYRYFANGMQWNNARLAATVNYGDPFEIVRRFIDRTLPSNSEYSLDYVSYEVYSAGNPGRYASRYGYHSYEEYYDLCLSAFGLRYTSHCGAYHGYNNGYYGRYYGPIIVAGPRGPKGDRPNKRAPRLRPLVPDPMVPSAGLDRQPAQGRFPRRDRDEALAQKRERIGDGSPRVYPKSERTKSDGMREREPVIYRGTPRSEPRSEPRVEKPRAEPRSEQPRMQAAPQRSEPRVYSRPQRAEPRSGQSGNKERN